MPPRATRAPPRARLLPSFDLPDLARSLASPRIDTRMWASYARVLNPWIDPTHGYLADVLLLPSGEHDTVRVGTLAATAGFFIYAPLWKNDLVLVVYPEGVTSEGGVIVCKPNWLESDPPPQDVLDNPQDLILFARSGKNVRVTTGGNGDIILNGGSLKVARDTDPVDASTSATGLPVPMSMAAWMSGVTTFINGLVPGTLPGVPTEVGKIDGGAEHVKA